jgi:hypothetical protein
MPYFFLLDFDSLEYEQLLHRMQMLSFHLSDFLDIALLHCVRSDILCDTRLGACDEHPQKMTAAQAANPTSDGPSEAAIN